MTAGFLTRLAERARGGGQSAAVRPDLPSAYVPGLLARAPAADFEGIGITELWPGADPAARDGPETGARSADPGRDPQLFRDAAEIPPPPAAGPGRVAEPAGSGGARRPEPEAWPPPAARAGRGPSRPWADGPPARHQQRRQQPSGAAHAVSVGPANPDDLAPARSGPDSFGAVRPDQPVAPVTDPEPTESRPQAVLRGTGTTGPVPHAAGPPRPGAREPDVHISIGRIEVRLEEATPAPGRAQRRPRPETAIPLEQYLRHRSGTSP
jgi:hypothetical protein